MSNLIYEYNADQKSFHTTGTVGADLKNPPKEVVDYLESKLNNFILVCGDETNVGAVSYLNASQGVFECMIGALNTSIMEVFNKLGLNILRKVVE